MEVTTPVGRSLGIVAALVFLVAGCGNGHAAASPVDYKKSPGVPTSVPTASKSAVKQAVRTSAPPSGVSGAPPASSATGLSWDIWPSSPYAALDGRSSSQPRPSQVAG